jgi:hypothetical protein
MAFESNIAALIAKLEALKVKVQTSSEKEIPPDFSDAIFSAVNAGMGLMKQRIFNEGKDAENTTLGVYTGKKSKVTKGKYSTAAEGADQFEEKARKKQKAALRKKLKASSDGLYTEYEKYRLSRGRQIKYKDLELEGSLRRSIECVKNGKIEVRIQDPEQSKIAGYQEKQIGNIRAGQNANKGTADPAAIFQFSRDEYEQVKKEGAAAIGQVIQKLLNDV